MPQLSSFVAAGLLLAAAAQAQPSQHSLPDSLAAPGTPTLVPRSGGAGGNVFGEGVVSDWQGNIYSNEMDQSNRDMQLKAGQDTSKPWRQATDNPNGMWLDSKNNIIICQTRAIVRVKAGATFDGKNDTLWKYPSGGQDINDVTGDGSDNLFFTNYSGNTVYFRNASTGETKSVLTGRPEPNGIEWDYDRKVLYVNEYQAGTVAAYDVAADYTLSARKDFASVPSADGICLDSLGNVYIVAGGQSVQVYSPSMKKLGEIPIPNQSLTNLDFGGADFKTLFMVTNKGLYKLPMKVRGYKKGQPSTVSLAWPGRSPRAAARDRLPAAIFRADGRRIAFPFKEVGGGALPLLIPGK